jgi:hypothetical protein
VPQKPGNDLQVAPSKLSVGVGCLPALGSFDGRRSVYITAKMSGL